MPLIRPITDLRNTNEISDFCHAQREPVFITKNGYGDLVLMSMETYEDMFETARTAGGRARSLPAAGAILREEDRGLEQLTLL